MNVSELKAGMVVKFKMPQGPWFLEEEGCRQLVLDEDGWATGTVKMDSEFDEGDQCWWTGISATATDGSLAYVHIEDSDTPYFTELKPANLKESDMKFTPGSKVSFKLNEDHNWENAPRKLVKDSKGMSFGTIARSGEGWLGILSAGTDGHPAYVHVEMAKHSSSYGEVEVLV